MMTRSAVLLLVVFALACSDPSTTAPSNTPTGAPAAGNSTDLVQVRERDGTYRQHSVTRMEATGVRIASLVGTCNGLPNVGSIIKIESFPATIEPTTTTFWVEGAIVRDDASWPGEQYYCNDTNNQVDWNTWTTPGGCLTPIDVSQAYTWELQLVCGVDNSWWRAIAIPKNTSGTILTTKRDTTLVKR
jgi:hypothetical protein